MNCTEVQERLSAFCDAELPPDESAQVADHLDSCPQCAQARVGFANLSDGVRQLATPSPPERIWQQLQQQLDDQGEVEPAKPSAKIVPPARRRWADHPMFRPALAVAALLLIAVGWITYETWLGSGNRDLLAADLEQYAQQLQRNPRAAQHLLLAKYDGRKMGLDDAVRLVGYRPAVANGLPPEYTVESVCLLKMPCCDCVQTVYRRSDGSKFAIFEYGKEQPVTFGDRPQSDVQCSGKTCRLSQINEQIAVTWKQDERRISVVGVRDHGEMENLVAWLD